MIKVRLLSALIILLLINFSCESSKPDKTLSESERLKIKMAIQSEIDKGVEATRMKDIDAYMSQIPKDLIIYDEEGKMISREKQKEFALRDWRIIDTTLGIMMQIDSLAFINKDSTKVYTYQEWERIMFQRDGVERDTVLTNQRHEEIWRKTPEGWFGYEVKELGGKVFINGEEYNNQ